MKTYYRSWKIPIIGLTFSILGFPILILEKNVILKFFSIIEIVFFLMPFISSISKNQRIELNNSGFKYYFNKKREPVIVNFENITYILDTSFFGISILHIGRKNNKELLLIVYGSVDFLKKIVDKSYNATIDKKIIKKINGK